MSKPRGGAAPATAPETLLRKATLAQTPGLRAKYERRYGQGYECTSPRAERLEGAFTDLVARWDMATRVRPYLEDAPQQLALL